MPWSQIWKVDSGHRQWPSVPEFAFTDLPPEQILSQTYMSLKQERDDKAQWSVTPTVTRAFVFYIFLFQMYRRVFLYEEGCEGWTIMDFSDQLCFRKLLTVLHRFLKTLFIMKSTKTIFAISSIRCIKPLNSSSSCSPEQVYFSKKQKNKKISKKKKTKDFYQMLWCKKMMGIDILFSYHCFYPYMHSHTDADLKKHYFFLNVW